MTSNTTRFYSLIALVALSFLLVFLVFRPFLAVLALAGVFAIVLQPLYRIILRGMRAVPGLASLVTILIAAVCIFTPLTLLSVQIAADAERLYTSLSDGSGRAYVDTLAQSANSTIAHYAPSLAIPEAELAASVDTYTKQVLAWALKNSTRAFGEASLFLVHLFVFLIALYYLLRDGSRLKHALTELSPLADSENEAVFERVTLAVHSVIRGSLFIALIQGVLTGIGFSLFGIPDGILWGVVAAFAALIPGIGTSLVLIPGIAYLFIIGATTPALGLLVWSLVAVGLIDNLLGPRLVGAGMRLHPLLVLLSVFGGLAFFGPAGIFLGPLSVSLLVAFLSIYQHMSRTPQPE